MAPKRRRLAAFSEEADAPTQPAAAPKKKAMYLPGDESDDEDDAPARPVLEEDYMSYVVPEGAARRAAPAEPCAKATAREREAETREKGLETPLDASNKGFQMLVKMGYESGALGRGSRGIEAPIVPEALARAGEKGAKVRTGVGAEAAAERAARALEDARRCPAARARADFHGTVADRAQARGSASAASRARKAARDLDERAGLPETPLWPTSRQGGAARSFRDPSGVVYAASLDAAAPDLPEGLDAEPPDVQLRTAVAYLRDHHNYCLSTGGAAWGSDAPSLDAELRCLVEEADD